MYPISNIEVNPEDKKTGAEDGPTLAEFKNSPEEVK